MACTDTIGVLTKSDYNKKTLREVDDRCTECICRASSHCQNFPCDSEYVCGEIPRKYSGAKHGFNDCKRDEICARDLIEKYYYEKRCDCTNKNKLNFNWVRSQPNDYDPRIGLRVDEFPDHDHQYEFNIPFGLEYGGTLTLYPRKRADRIIAKMYFDKKLDLFHCVITTPGIYGQPHILIGKCESFAECPLKFEPLWPAVLTSGYSQLTNQFEELTPTGNDPQTSFTTTYSHGYLECFGTYNRAQFLSKIDYFFTGLDNTKYLMSGLFPPESIIKLSSKQELSMKVGTTYSFDCKISTFILLPNIKFVLGFQNGTEYLVSSHTTEDIIDSSALANDAAYPNPSSKNTVGSQDNVNDPADQIQIFLMIGGAIAGLIIILLVVISVFLATRKNVVVVKNLSPKEVDGFIL
ncbi:unnamed protein product, partial [Allacma fusca]